MYDQIAKTINLLDKTHISISKSLNNIEETEKYIKDGKTSLFFKAEKMRELGANTKTKLKTKNENFNL